MTLPRLMVAAPATGHGKTTVATGLMAALRSSGLTVSGHKVGPDYIDPGYHALATARPGRNLDPHLVGEERIVPLLLHGASGADVAVIEGVMGLYDGRLGTDGFASSAHVATITRTPVVLVVDVGRSSRTVGAIVAGLAAYDDEVQVVGVILNRARRGRNLTEITRAVPVPVLGALPPDDRIAAPSRHLGLVPAVERDGSSDVIERLGEQVSRHVDLEAILHVARAASDLEGTAWNPLAEVRPVGPRRQRPVVAVAGGRAFTFRYAETDELLAAAGCDVAIFDPMSDAALPAGTQGIYLGGGFPEVYAHELAANRRLLADLKDAVAAGIPTVAECAGLLYLAETLEGLPMAGAIRASAAMAGRLTLRYPDATAASDSLLGRAGEHVTGHEFHRTTTDPASGARAAWVIDGDETGYASETLHASYLHVHWAGHPALAQRFAHATAASQARATSRSSTATIDVARHVPRESYEPVREPLRHHGDAEVTADVEDFAVNVYAGPRPRWLDDALRASLADVSSYPDATHAREVLAQRHGRRIHETLATSGAAEAFALLARLEDWRRPVVVHPQFTEPHAALVAAEHQVTTVLCRPDDDFALDPQRVPEDADLVFVGNPTNPTGVLHRAEVICRLLRRGRVVVVDEAFIDAVPGEAESLARERQPGLVVVRSLTKHWAIPGIRAGYVVGDAAVVRRMTAVQTPWSVSASAIAAMIVCSSRTATPESRERVLSIERWRRTLQRGLADRDIRHVPSAAPFVLAQVGHGVHRGLRRAGFAVRRADTFPGLDDTWVRIAVRPEVDTRRLLAAMDTVVPARRRTVSSRSSA